MTYPLIGNYGICMEDMESIHPWPKALIVRECAKLASNFRNEMTLDEFLKKYDVPGISGIDTRHLTRILSCLLYTSIIWQSQNSVCLLLETFFLTFLKLYQLTIFL